MTSLVDDIITSLKDGGAVTLTEALRQAGLLFEEAHIVRERLNVAEQASQFIWTSKVIAALMCYHYYGEWLATLLGLSEWVACNSGCWILKIHSSSYPIQHERVQP